MFFLIITIVSATETNLCEDVVPVNTLCKMATPILLTCDSLTYDVIHENGTVMETGNLALLETNVYYFNFTQPIGEYIVRLCDNRATREIVVRDRDEMSWLAIVLSILGGTALFGMISFRIREKALRPIKIFLFILTLTNTFVLGFMPYLITLNPSDVASILPFATGFFIMNLFGLVGVIWVYAFFIFGKGFKTGADTMGNAPLIKGDKF